jgi:hypothetical protein
LAAAIERNQTSLESMRRLTDATRYRTDQLRLEAQKAADGIRGERARLEKERHDWNGWKGVRIPVRARLRDRVARFVVLAGDPEFPPVASQLPVLLSRR